MKAHSGYMILIMATALCLSACQPETSVIVFPEEEKPDFPATDFSYYLPDADSIRNVLEDWVENTEFSDSIVEISFSGNGYTAINPWQDDGIRLEQSDGELVCTVSTESRVVFHLTGSGQMGFKLYSPRKVKLLLENLQLTNSKGPALNLQGKKRQFILLSGENTLTGKGYDTADGKEQAKAALFGEGQLIFSGDGSLTVRSAGKHGIASDDYVRIHSGNLTVISAEDRANKDGIHAKDGFVMDGGSLVVESRDEGIQAGGDDHPGYCHILGGEIRILAANGDGIKSTGDLCVTDGSLQVQSVRNEGIESKRNLLIEGGTIEVTAKDDAVNVGLLLTINGGRVYACSSDNDALDSNHDFIINGGIVVGIASHTPETALDADGGSLIINGGTVLGIGDNSFMFVYPSLSSRQYSTEMLLDNETSYNIGNDTYPEAMNFDIPATTYTTRILVSSPYLTEGDQRVQKDVSLEGGEVWHGLHLGATHSGGKYWRDVTAFLGKLKNH